MALFDLENEAFTTMEVSTYRGISGCEEENVKGIRQLERCHQLFRLGNHRIMNRIFYLIKVLEAL